MHIKLYTVYLYTVQPSNYTVTYAFCIRIYSMYLYHNSVSQKGTYNRHKTKALINCD